MNNLPNTVSFLGIPLTFVTTRTLENGQEVSVWRLVDRTESYVFWRYFGVIPAPSTYLGYRIVCQLFVLNELADELSVEKVVNEVVAEVVKKIKEKL